MTTGPGQLLVLDTNILVHLVRNDATGRHLEQTYALSSRPDRPLFSTVSEGEILGLAAYWRWGQQKKTILRGLLAQLVPVEAGLPQVVEAFAELFYEMRRTSHPTSDNDLWIAATTKAVGAVLLTNDTDFDWMHPTLINRIYVAPVP